MSETAVRRLDPALDAIVPSDAHLEIIHEDHTGFFEGPTWIPDRAGGHLIFTDIVGNVIRRWDASTGVTTLVDEVSKGADRSEGHLLDLGFRQVLLIGANGTTVDREGRISYCGYGTREVVRIEMDGRHRVLADRYRGLLLNRPNDLVFRSDGALYFTDSAADCHRAHDDPTRGVPHTGVYMLRDGDLRLLIENFVVPNGLAFSPDEQQLYVNDTRRKQIVRYDVRPDGTLEHGTLFIDMTSDPTPGEPDGMKVDRQGRVYCTGPGGLWIVTSQGRHIGTILTPEPLTNVSFGAADNRTLFLTGCSYVYRIALCGQRDGT
ncbi:SMP-30/gluconolactonase/LRE family protein [Bradyrhizobium sp. SRL28]|uniref:SMP-30/gluconolactonase/LRE family protein n=1 Tax=Bradyrhizobium sp. SRL28 TaxID=2836178 RepID=UPI001BDE35CD|nr:SMP-30/gluconolactonase/LRE family protein [Bradyrhizobium sp. SRL28]MBT1517152.1 SMP-30/gluconolactonase/LRE family protein [Bradyrhizobium sp. SRL28]